MDTLKSFVAGTLPGPKREEIEKAMKVSEELQAVVEGLRYFEESRKDGEESLEEFMDSIWEDHRTRIRDVSSAAPRTRRLWPYWTAAVAAAVAILLLFIPGTPNQKIPYTPATYAQKSLEAIYPMENGFRGGDSEVKVNWREKYQAGEYQEVISIFQSVDTIMSEEPLFFLAMSFVKTENYEEAIPIFEEVIEKNNINGYWEQSRFYLALCYVSTENIDAAKRFLLDISNEQKHYKKAQADTLLLLLNE